MATNNNYYEADNIKNEKTDFKDILEDHNVYIGKIGNKYFAATFIIIFLIRGSVMFYYDHDFKHLAQKDIVLLKMFLDILQVCICLTISLIPEALMLAVIICLSEYTSMSLIESGKLVFRKLKALETMGNINCLCIEKEGTLTMSDNMQVAVIQIYGVSHKNY